MSYKDLRERLHKLLDCIVSYQVEEKSRVTSSL